MQPLIRTLLVVAVLSGSPGASAQRTLDAILQSLHNKDVYVSPVIRGVHMGSVDPAINRDSARTNMHFFRVISLDEDIRELAAIFGRKVLVEKLYTLLQDSTKDFYANVLLYDLLDNRKLGRFLFDWESRAQWIGSGGKIRDEEKWRAFMKNGSSGD